MLLKNHNVIYLYGEQCLAYVFDNPLCCSFSVLSRCECYVYLTNYSDKYIKNLFTFVQEKLILLLIYC